MLPAYPKVRPQAHTSIHASFAYAVVRRFARPCCQNQNSFHPRSPPHSGQACRTHYGRPSPTYHRPSASAQICGRRCRIGRNLGHVLGAMPATWTTTVNSIRCSSSKHPPITVPETKQTPVEAPRRAPGSVNVLRPTVVSRQPLEVSTSASTKKPDGDAPDTRGMIPNTKRPHMRPPYPRTPFARERNQISPRSRSSNSHPCDTDAAHVRLHRSLRASREVAHRGRPAPRPSGFASSDSRLGVLPCPSRSTRAHLWMRM
ncbi:hypothetical protein OH76DRAFT_372719 [Lentinus brumalis]|uniref:Uncharacterized protein n=1 Tax=Lentinus brumalis TaxID=2498619 RepID=A0A371DED6_9APHY|nr:hypothetical protein OH76DRAFT_372719 [Polyporus brumalis]